MIDRGKGVPVVLIPGLQGRWEWHAPGIDALARRCRVITYSLSGEPGAPMLKPPAAGTAGGIGDLSRQLETVLDRAGVDRAVVCGVSFGGIVALHFAATRPERTAGLALVSTPGPSWRADARVRRHLRWPRLLAPWFIATSPLRLAPEVLAACPGDGQFRVIRGLPRAAAFMVRHGARVIAAPMAPRRMATRVRVLMSMDTPADCTRVAAPTLVVTGEPSLDRVVSVAGSREYVQAIRDVRHVTLERTGHIGLVTRPARFADVVSRFAVECMRAEMAEPSSAVDTRSPCRR